MSSLNKSLVCTFLVLGLLLTATSVEAGLLDPTDITASSSFGSGTSWVPSNLHDDPTLTASTDMAVVPRVGDGGHLWVSGLRILTNVTVTLDFGADVDMDDFVLWNYVSTFSADLNRGIKDFTISFATDSEGDGGFGTSIPDTGLFTAAISVDELSSDPDNSGTSGQVFDFTNVTARYLRVNIANQYGNTLFVGAKIKGEIA